MEFPLILIADYANITSEGKLNVMGIFTTINAFGFPVSHGEMYLLTQLLAGPDEYGRSFDLIVNLIDEDGLEILSIPTKGVVPTGLKGEHVTVNLVIRLQQIVFPHPGRYEFTIEVDDEQRSALGIEVQKIEIIPPSATEGQ